MNKGTEVSYFVDCPDNGLCLCFCTVSVVDPSTVGFDWRGCEERNGSELCQRCEIEGIKHIRTNKITVERYSQTILTIK